MEEQSGYIVWLPIIVTFGVWMTAIFIIHASVSRMWADLFGLFYLMASPFIYGQLTSIVGVDTGDAEANPDPARMWNPEA
ncbi:MAG: hypothetical protein ABEH59_00545 [Halobacteriales archaeon]